MPKPPLWRAKVAAFLAMPVQTCSTLCVLLLDIEMAHPPNTAFPVELHVVLDKCLPALSDAERLKMLAVIQNQTIPLQHFEYCSTTSLVGQLLIDGHIDAGQIAAYSPFFLGDGKLLEHLLLLKGITLQRLDHMNIIVQAIRHFF